MKKIKLTRGYHTMVDDDDYEFLKKYKWRVRIDKWNAYAERTEPVNGENVVMGMHRVLLLAVDSKTFVDHRNGNGLDNRSENLRICSMSQNQWNQKPRLGGSSKYKGVYWCKINRFWIATIKYLGKSYGLGYYRNEKKAAQAYDKRAIELFGEFAWTNFQEEVNVK